MNTPHLHVNTRRLLTNALCSGWPDCCRRILLALPGNTDPLLSAEENIRRLPTRVAFAELRDKVVGSQLLDAIDALECDDLAPASGRLLLALAKEFFLPKLPAQHPGYLGANGLLAVLEDYLDGKATAEAYIGTAYRFRSDYGTSITAAGTDSVYESLFDALPASGLDCPAGEGCWNLAMHWNSFGRFLAEQRSEWRLLDSIDEELDFLALHLHPDPAASQDAAKVVRTEIIDLQREALAEGELDALDDELTAVIARFFPVNQQPSPADRAAAGAPGRPFNPTMMNFLKTGSYGIRDKGLQPNPSMRPDSHIAAASTAEARDIAPQSDPATAPDSGAIQSPPPAA